MIKLAACFLVAVSVQAAEPGLMPWPAKVSFGKGSLPIDQTLRVALTGCQEARMSAAAERFIARLALQTGMPLIGSIESNPSHATLAINCEHASDPFQSLGEDESYQLDVTANQAKLSAPNPLGILHGFETFLQLVEAGPNGFDVPQVNIADHPRFAWRGLHLDVARHWIPLEVVKRNLDGMAAVKLNVFHWHLSDDQGFRIESKRFPRLQELGSDGHFYTQDQVRDLIYYARDRGIRIVPEFDVPGHTTSWLVGYPQLASAPGPFEIQRHWGPSDAAMDPTRESTYEFLDAFFGEMAALFPDQYFHIGGDEVDGEKWLANESIREFMREHNIKDAHQLQAYFNQRVQSILAKYGKRMEGWDEILDPALPKDIVIQSWRGRKSLADAAKLGYHTILSSGYYLDHIDPASTMYAVDPLEGDAAALSPEEQARILGGEVAMWGEFVDAENIDSRIWPRTAAIAERFWSPQDIKNVASMYQRLEAVSRKLDWLGLTHHSSYYTMLERLAGNNPFEPLKILADVVQPANLGPRTQTNKYTQQTPLNRLVDAARPDSRVARDFAALVAGMDREQIRAWLTRWRDNDRKLRPILESSFLLEEDVPVSENLSRLGAIGLEALSYLDRRERPPANWLAEQASFVENAWKFQAELRLAIIPSIGKLLEAAADQ